MTKAQPILSLHVHMTVWQSQSWKMRFILYVIVPATETMGSFLSRAALFAIIYATEDASMLDHCRPLWQLQR